MSEYKCLLVGDGGTGKTSLIKRLVTGQFSTLYSATSGYEVEYLTIHSKNSSTKLKLNVWDVSGQTSAGNLLKEILSGAHCAIIVYDVTSRITFKNVAIWYREIIRASGSNIPIVIVGKKIDMPARNIKIETMLRKFTSGIIQYYDISVKTKFNIEQPILWIAAQLLQSSDNQIEEKSQIVPQDLKVSGEESFYGSEDEDYPKPLSDGQKINRQSRPRNWRGGGPNSASAMGVLKNYDKSVKEIQDKENKKKIK